MPACRRLDLDGVIEIVPDRHADARGFFAETYRADTWKECGVDADFVQDNHSLSASAGVFRGLHFQLPPFAQAKLVRVVRGAVFDVAVDIRRNSPDFGKWVGLELTAEKGNQLYIPAGFAHGFLTLVPDTEFLYKVSAYYAPAHDRTIRYDDPQIGLVLPRIEADIILSEKDRSAPLLSEVETGFSL